MSQKITTHFSVVLYWGNLHPNLRYPWGTPVPSQLKTLAGVYVITSKLEGNKKSQTPKVVILLLVLSPNPSFSWNSSLECCYYHWHPRHPNSPYIASHQVRLIFPLRYFFVSISSFSFYSCCLRLYEGWILISQGWNYLSNRI